MSALRTAADVWLETKSALDEAKAREQAARAALEEERNGETKFALPDRNILLCWTPLRRWKWNAKLLKEKLVDWEQFGSESMSERLTVKPLNEGES